MFYAQIKAVESYFSTQTSCPINIKFMIEGEEEIGSTQLAKCLTERPDLFECDAVFVSDSPKFASHVPSLCKSIRGLVYMDVTVSALPSDVHSGQLGGGVPNVIHYVAQCIASFKDPVTNRITIPHFYDDVIPDDSFDDTTAVAKEALKTIRDWGNMPHDPPNYFDQIWFQPTLDCHGITSGFTEDGTKTVIPATASFKCSARLVNGQCPETMQRLIATYITDFFPDHFTVTVTPLGPLAKPMSVPLNDPYFQCAKDAVQATHGSPPIIQGEGGSIPILAEIQATINRPVILIGMNAPNDNIHAPNERFKQTDYHDGIITYIHLIDTINAITH